VIALDRMERGAGKLSAVAEMEAETGVRVVSLVSVREILAYLAAGHDAGRIPVDTVESIYRYQSLHGVI